MFNISKKRQINRLVSLLATGKKYKTVADLEMGMSLSRRSVFYWLKQLNITLQHLKLDNVQRLTSGGYFLTQATLDELSHYEQAAAEPVVNATARRQLIIWYLVQEEPHLSLVHLAERLKVSKNTIIKDFKRLPPMLPTNTVIINTSHGKALRGLEKGKRRWVYQQLVQRNQAIIHQVQQLPHLENIRRQLHDLQTTTGNVYSEDAVQTLIWYIGWLVQRLAAGKRVVAETKLTLIDPLDQWCDAVLTTYAVSTLAEVKGLRELLLAGQLQHVNEQTSFDQHLLVITRKVVRRFCSVSGIDVLTDSFLKALVTHLHAAYFRIKYHVPYHYIDLTQTKVTYQHLMSLTQFSLRPFEQFLKMAIPSDELALITVYFGGEIRRLSPDWLASAKHPDVWLVCTSGIGTSQLLYQQLATRYPSIVFSQPMSLEDFYRHDLIDERPKLILSTAKMPETIAVPTLWVQAIPSSNDFQRLNQAFYRVGLLDDSGGAQLVQAVLDIITDYARVDDFTGLTGSLRDYFQQTPVTQRVGERRSLAALISEDHIQVLAGVSDWTVAVHQALRPLEIAGIVDPDYANHIIEATQTNGPYMVLKEGIMLAHSKPTDGVNELGMSVLILKTPVVLSAHGQQRSLRVIFGLAPTDRQTHVQALSQLLALLQNEELYQRLILADNHDEVHHVLVEATALIS